MNGYDKKVLIEIKKYLADGRKVSAREISKHLVNSNLNLKLGLTTREIVYFFKRNSEDFDITKINGLNFYSLKGDTNQ